VIVVLFLLFIAGWIEAIISSLASLFFLVVLSIFFAYLIDPLVRFIRRPFKARGIDRFMPRSLAIVISYLIVFSIVGFAIANIAPREFCEIYGLAREGRWDEAQAIAARMMLADRGVPGRYGIGGLKAALDLQGGYGGPCRAPLGTPDGDAIDEITESLASAGLL